MSFPVASALALKTAGTPAAPGYGFASYSGTGTFSGSQTINGTAYPFLGVAANGVEVGRFVGASLGLGVSIPVAQFHAYGAGQSTAAVNTAGAGGGAIVVQDANGSAGNGGSIWFGALQGLFAAFKGLLTNGSGNSQGDVAISLRAAAGDATLTERWRWMADGTYRPAADGTQNLASPSQRLNNIYIVNNPTVSSDATLKTVRAVVAGGPTPTAAEVAAWASVSGKIWSFKADPAGPVHCCYIAQEVEAAFAAQGLDATKYGLLSKATLADGSTRYSLVYGECAILEAAYQRGIAQTLKTQVELLQRQVATLATRAGVTLPTS